MKKSFQRSCKNTLLPGSSVGLNSRRLGGQLALTLIALSLCSGPLQAALQFSEVSVATGAAVAHGFSHPVAEIDESESGGVAAADYDNDGDVDLYVIGGTANSNQLLKNTVNVDGTFVNVAAAAGVALSGIWSSGPVFADINGDGWQDLLVGSMQGDGYHVFINNQDGTFTNASLASGITQGANQNDISSGLGDADNDGDLDLFIAHHSFNIPNLIRNHLWINNGSGEFTAGDITRGLNTSFTFLDRTFSATFADINKDHWQDIVVSADSGKSTVFKNDGDGTFTNVTNLSTINDQNGMGSAAADLDNDGDIDWFVTSINNHPDYSWDKTGNRLYINNGSGVFSETSAAAGVRPGYWGWAACAADFDNDGWLDLFHVNGMYNLGGWEDHYLDDPSRLFMNKHNGTFTEGSAAADLVDTGQGRALVCFDYDSDGDIDIFVFNAGGTSSLFKNGLSNNPGWLQVDVAAETLGKTIAGALIEVVTGAMTQTRQVTVGSNFASQNPLRQHFGLGGAQTVDQIKVTWPSGAQRTLNSVGINQILLVEPPPPPELPIFTNGFES